MTDFLIKLRDSWGRLSRGQRIQLGLGLATTVGLVWALGLYAMHARYGVLFSRLERDIATAVVDELSQRRIPYRLSAGGSTIEVPVGWVDDARLMLAGEGLPPRGGVGFEGRALERELSRTIESLDAVESARVHLALPPGNVAPDGRREPSASVVVRLRAGGSLAPAKVQAIAHLVASGVEGLTAANVSVIDGQGRMLSDAAEAADQGTSTSQTDAKRGMERNIEATLVSILEPVVGPGRVRARATVELNMTRVQRTQETYDPNVAVVRSEQKTKTRDKGSAADLSQSSQTSFELNKTISTIAEPAGTLTRQSVAVVVDHAPAPTPAPRDAEEMKKITDLVRAAIGIDESRGDVLIVENVPFDGQAQAGPEATGGGLDWGLLLKLARYASWPLAVLLLAFLVIRPALATLRGLRGGGPAATAPQTVAQLQTQLRRQLEAEGLGEGASPLRRKLIEAATEDPRAAALAIRSWLESGPEKKA